MRDLGNGGTTTNDTDEEEEEPGGNCRRGGKKKGLINFQVPSFSLFPPQERAVQCSLIETCHVLGGGGTRYL